MKKLALLSCLCFSSAFAGSLSDDNDYGPIWGEIYTGDYGLAAYHLKDMDIEDAEDEIHTLLIKLFIAVKKGKTAAQYDIVDQIEEIVEDAYVK